MNNYPVCLVEIHGENETYELTPEPGRPLGSSPSNDLISCVTNKRISMEAVGTFELALAHTRDAQGRTWADKIRPQNLVVVQMMNHTGAQGPDGAGELHTVMIGLVDQVTQAVAINQQGKPERVITVTGRDAGKMFTQGMVTYWNFLGANLLGANSFVDVSVFNAKPSIIIRELLTNIYERFMRATFRVYGTDVTFWDLLAYDLSSYDAELPLGLDMKFIVGEGSFWSFFVKVASPPFHELFIDTRRATTTDAVSRETKAPRYTLGKDGSAPTVVLRPTPFPYLTPPANPSKYRVEGAGGEEVITVQEVSVIDREWDNLVRHEVGHTDGLRGEPMGEQLSRSDREQYNLYMPQPTYPVIPERLFTLSVPPILDRARFHRYGYRPLTPPCELIQPKQGADYTEPIFEFYTKLAWRLASWNVMNDQFKSGTKTLQLSPHLHVGERLVDRSPWQHEVYEFYIEGVTHRYVFGGACTTTVGLTRGLPEETYARFGELAAEHGLEALDPSTVSQAYQNLMKIGQEAQH
jgi:hypothetical protein